MEIEGIIILCRFDRCFPSSSILREIIILLHLMNFDVNCKSLFRFFAEVSRILLRTYFFIFYLRFSTSFAAYNRKLMERNGDFIYFYTKKEERELYKFISNFLSACFVSKIYKIISNLIQFFPRTKWWYKVTWNEISA